MAMTSPKPKRRLIPSRFNEQIKLGAAALDRVNTVVFAGALLAPILQDQPIRLPRVAFWGAATLIIYAAAQILLFYNMQEEL